MFLTWMDENGGLFFAGYTGAQPADWHKDLSRYAGDDATAMLDMRRDGVSDEAASHEILRRQVTRNFMGAFPHCFGMSGKMLDAEEYEAARLRALACPAAVKAEAGRRIDAVYPLWRQMNVLREGTDEQKAAMTAIIDAIRAASNRIEAMAPIPLDFRGDGYWQEG